MSWKDDLTREESDKAFLFVLSGDDRSSPYRHPILKLRKEDETVCPIFHSSYCGPIFGAGTRAGLYNDFRVAFWKGMNLTPRLNLEVVWTKT